MPHPAAASLVVLLLAATALIGCGEEDAQLLPGETAREITADLNAVQRLADEGDCLGAESAALQVSEQVEALDGVDERLKRALRAGTARLNEVVVDCEATEEAAVPDTTATEPEPSDEEESEKDHKAREKAEEKAEKEREKAEEEREGEAEEAEEEERQSPPPEANGEGKGLGKGEGNGPGGDGEGGGTPAGGVSPGSPAGGEGD